MHPRATPLAQTASLAAIPRATVVTEHEITTEVATRLVTPIRVPFAIRSPVQSALDRRRYCRQSLSTPLIVFSRGLHPTLSHFFLMRPIRAARRPSKLLFGHVSIKPSTIPNRAAMQSITAYENAITGRAIQRDLTKARLMVLGSKFIQNIFFQSNNMKAQKMKKLIRNNKGQGLVEYGILVGGIALVALAATAILGHKTTDLIATTAAALPCAHDEEAGAIVSGKLVATTAEQPTGLD